MRVRKLLVAAAFAMLVSFAFQSQPKPIPPFGGDGNPQHDGQPEHCQNHDHNGWLHNCDCRAGEEKHCPKDGSMEPESDDGDEPTGRESSKCKVYCRKDKCGCITPCGG